MLQILHSHCLLASRLGMHATTRFHSLSIVIQFQNFDPRLELRLLLGPEIKEIKRLRSYQGNHQNYTDCHKERRTKKTKYNNRRDPNHTRHPAKNSNSPYQSPSHNKRRQTTTDPCVIGQKSSIQGHGAKAKGWARQEDN